MPATTTKKRTKKRAKAKAKSAKGNTKRSTARSRAKKPGAAAPPYTRHTDEAIAKALVKQDGMVSFAARNLGCAPKTIYERMKQNPELGDIVRDSRTELLDIAESKLKAKCKSGNLGAIQFTLRTVGKDRGYVERREIGGEGGGAIPLDIAGLVELADKYRKERLLQDQNEGGDGVRDPFASRIEIEEADVGGSEDE